MIKGHCRTNLDDWQQYTWPKCFAAVPRVGDYMLSKERRRLKVVSVSHYEEKVTDYTYEPRIEVELNK